MSEQHPWRTALEGTIAKMGQRIEELEAQLRQSASPACERTIEACIQIVQSELDKLGGRWSLDSCYLNQAIKNLREYGADHAVPLAYEADPCRTPLHLNSDVAREIADSPWVIDPTPIPTTRASDIADSPWPWHPGLMCLCPECRLCR